MAEKQKIKPIVVTINRQFGAGGRTVAKALSEKLDIPWFDKDFVKKTASESGFLEEDIIADGEEISGSQKVLDKILNNANSYTSSHDAIYNAQKKVIIELAQNDCIIVGRCANRILNEVGIESFNIFLMADKDIRINRTKQKENLSDIEAKKLVEKHDNLRGNYYKNYVGHSLNTADDYNICIDTGVLDYNKCVEMLVDIFSSK